MLLLIRKEIVDIIDLQRQVTKPFVIIDLTFLEFIDTSFYLISARWKYSLIQLVRPDCVIF